MVEKKWDILSQTEYSGKKVSGNASIFGTFRESVQLGRNPSEQEEVKAKSWFSGHNDIFKNEHDRLLVKVKTEILLEVLVKALVQVICSQTQSSSQYTTSKF